MTFNFDIAGITPHDVDWKGNWKFGINSITPQGSGKKLPDGVIELEYLQSDGTAYIDTGVVGKDTLEIGMSLKDTTLDSKFLFGYNAAASINSIFFLNYSTSLVQFGKQRISNPLIVGDNKIKLNKDGLTVNDNVVPITGVSPFKSSYTMPIFGARAENSLNMDSRITKNKVESAYIKDDGVTLRDFIPVIWTNGEYGMWDSTSVSRNLLKLPTGTSSMSGLTITSNGNSATLSGTATSAYVYYKLSGNTTDIKISLSQVVEASEGDAVIAKAGKTYTLSVKPAVTDEDSVAIIYSDLTRVVVAPKSAGVYTFEATKDVIAIWGRVVNETTVETTFKAQLEEGSTPTKIGGFYGNASSTGSFTGKVLLPDGYTAVDYIESDGVAYIDTGYIPNNNSYAKLTAQALIPQSTGWLGCRRSSSENKFTIGSGNSSTKFVTAFGSVQNVDVANFDTNVHTIEISRNETKFDGTIFSSAISGNLTSTLPVYLFAYNQLRNSPYLCSTLKMFDCTLKENNTTARNFIPCSNPQGEFGMYDLVTNQFFGNANSVGSFTGGLLNGMIATMELDNEDYEQLAGLQSATLELDDTNIESEEL